VNRFFVSFIDPNGYIILKDGTKVELSRRKKEEVIEQLKKL
jgi:hypothetical protein